MHRHTGGIPRRVNQLMQRVLLAAALEHAELVTAATVEAAAADMGSETVTPPPQTAPVEVAEPVATVAAAPEPVGEKVFSLRSARRAPEPVPTPQLVPVPDPMLEQRLAELEARTEEQEALLRRVLILLVDWVENAHEEAYHRTHAA